MKVKTLLICYGLCQLMTLPLWSQSDDFYTRAKINDKGDYLTNAGPVTGKALPGQTPGALWRVISKQLNCRQQADVNAKIQLVFKHGALLQAHLGRGGSDEVLYNAKDPRGKTWMHVRLSAHSLNGCYVRANRLFIRPLQK